MQASIRQFVKAARCQLFVRSLFTCLSTNLLAMPGNPICELFPESDYWDEFIEMYKARPVLWKYGSKVYRDRRAKRLAYLDLVQKLKEVEPRANVDMVKRKINSLRSCFRREMFKMQRSRLNGDTPSTRWRYFDSFAFLREYSRDLPEGASEEPCKYTIEQDNGVNSEPCKYDTIEQDNSVNNDILAETTFEFIAPKQKRRTKREFVPSSPPPPPRREESGNTSYKRLKHEHDEADILGISWSYQYRDLTKNQKLYAKKAIDDILFEARLETLHRNSVKINETSCSTCGGAQFIELPASPDKNLLSD